MEAIILAGGFGTRLRDVVSDLPKPMAPVKGRPFLEYILDMLQGFCYDHIVLSTGYMHEKREQHFGNAYNGMSIDYAREVTPLGTGGGIRNALQQCSDDVVTVLNGDTLFRVDFRALRLFFDTHSTQLAVVLRHVSDTSRYGSVLTDADSRITAFTEKGGPGGPGLINGGIYMMHKQLLDAYAPKQPFSFEKEVLQSLYPTLPFYAYASNAYFIDIGIPDDYYRAEREL